METRNQGKKRVTPRRPCCRTGDCPSCAEDTRWERLFRHKFADPFYYSPKPLRSVSPLAGF
ncbi:MAG: hypothetical protein LAP87_21245 [Acidobacteriia bacterium]|nr:hypothetical protein [Terriglobia bacterium]